MRARMQETKVQFDELHWLAAGRGEPAEVCAGRGELVQVCTVHVHGHPLGAGWGESCQRSQGSAPTHCRQVSHEQLAYAYPIGVGAMPRPPFQHHAPPVAHLLPV